MSSSSDIVPNTANDLVQPLETTMRFPVRQVRGGCAVGIALHRAWCRGDFDDDVILVDGDGEANEGCGTTTNASADE
jgi:hypothetical protein